MPTLPVSDSPSNERDELLRVWFDNYRKMREQQRASGAEDYYAKNLEDELKSMEESGPLALFGGDPAGGGAARAIVPTAANVKEFNRLMARARLQFNESPPMFKQAISYVAARYPRIARKLNHIYSTRANVKGFFDPDSVVTGINTEAHDSVGDLVNTLMHEAIHARDYSRNNKWATNPVLNMLRIQAGALADLTRPLSTRLSDALYRAHPLERRAYRAGDTAAKSWEKYSTGKLGQK